MRPDQHPRLLAMGACEAACDVCMFQLFPQAPDTICDDCNLNPMKDPASASNFMKEALDREFSLPLDEVATRYAIGSLAADRPE